ncbi:hypothetical protein INT43_003118 [Umbelopsis isabellina]|uniref:Ubiquitin-like domain-containing protein n=1 Tax=Mortierella isabellina TaxID=91625 RepID=A0A8H7PRE7_MORIS|nr:hypothetical protein INT43_003118 [Umbelopsis isabellina]
MLTEEPEFIVKYLNDLSSRSVRYGITHTPQVFQHKKLLKRQPPKKSSISQVEKPAVDESAPSSQSTTNAAQSTIKVTVKTLKPASQFEIFNLQPTDTIATLKDRISQQRSIPIKQQRLLVKGKVLNDTKPLAEYAISNDTVVHLMVKASPASPAKTADIPSPVESSVGAHGVSKEAESTLQTPELWKNLHNVLKESLGEQDAKVVISRFLQSEGWTGVTYDQIQ